MNLALLGRPKLRYTVGTVAVTCDGNSLTAGSLASGPSAYYPAVLATLSTLAPGSIPVANLGVAGQTAAQMQASQADVTAAWVSGKTNVLIAWELTNSLYYAATAQQAVTDLLNYVTSVKAANVWKVIVMTAIPRYMPRSTDGSTWGQTEVNAFNAIMNDANALLRAQWSGVADALCDLRDGSSGFAFSSYTSAVFDGSGLYNQEAITGGTARVHCSDAGYAEVARLANLTLARLPR